MSEQIAEKERLASQIKWLTEQLRPYCNKRSQELIAQAVNLAIEDLRKDCGIALDDEFCNRYGLPEANCSDQYTLEEALFVVLNHDDFYPDFSAVKGKFKPTAVIAASALNYLEGAQSSLSCGDLHIASTKIDTAIKLREHLASVIKRDDKQKKLIADSKAGHIACVRSKAVKASERYEVNGIIRQPIIDYFETVNTIINGNQSYRDMDKEDIERLLIKLALTAGKVDSSIPELQQFSDKDKNDLLDSADKMLREYGYKLDDGYLRRTIKRLTDAPSN